MPYVDRNNAGNVVGVYAVAQRDGHEFAESAELWIEPKTAVRAQISQLEQQQLMPRATREFMLQFMELNAPTEVLEVNPGYQAVKAFDNQIKALRDQL